MEVAPLQWDLGYMFLQSHKQDALAVEDLQAPDGFPPPLWEKLNFFQQTAACGLTQGSPYFLDGAIICKERQDSKEIKLAGSTAILREAE